MNSLNSIKLSYVFHIISRNCAMSCMRKIIDKDDKNTLLWMVRYCMED